MEKGRLWRLAGVAGCAGDRRAAGWGRDGMEDAGTATADRCTRAVGDCALRLATRRVAEAGDVEGWRLLRELCGDLVELRRGDHSAERLRMERERLDLEREQSRENTEEELWAWAMQEENRERICRGFKTTAAKIALIRKIIFGDRPSCAQKEETSPAPADTRRRERLEMNPVGTNLPTNQRLPGRRAAMVRPPALSEDDSLLAPLARPERAVHDSRLASSVRGCPYVRVVLAKSHSRFPRPRRIPFADH